MSEPAEEESRNSGEGAETIRETPGVSAAMKSAEASEGGSRRIFVSLPPPVEPASPESRRATRILWSRTTSWRRRHADILVAIEWVAAALFLLLALYFLWLLLFPPLPIAASPDEIVRAEFRSRLRLLPMPEADPDWRVASAPGRWRGVVIHHTATSGGNAEGIDRFHKTVNRWENGLGYHFLIGNGKGMGDGEVAVGRRWREQSRMNGSHVVMTDAAKGGVFNMPHTAKGNEFAIGVALVGNFQIGLPTPSQLAALLCLLSFLRKEYGFGADAIVGHGAVSASGTDCPGRGLLVDEIILVLSRP
ncbi:MAG: peptidoglycan recognition protein family protein [Planctomycetota bacterium]|jgi:hypothetical protein|nr:peptidoglycan recognition protein family protein [Planctomycetota bacterium]